MCFQIKLIVLLTILSTGVMAAESIPDETLETLYGGHWFYNPYCGIYGSGCPAFVPDPVDCEPLDLCRFCAAKTGLKCYDRWNSWLWDWDGCNDGTKPCENAGWAPGVTPWGFCGAGGCNENYDPTKDYPDCGSAEYNWCHD